MMRYITRLWANEVRFWSASFLSLGADGYLELAELVAALVRQWQDEGGMCLGERGACSRRCSEGCP